MYIIVDYIILPHARNVKKQVLQCCCMDFSAPIICFIPTITNLPGIIIQNDFDK